ncbi:LPXTG-motif cell wall anchor domain protein [Lactobacillus jensenii 1153]|uniref:YSIRK signal domain/LPXTG anchor domain surface protein n=2 Tax=Lactobacillus jensenii TaxID=109790 RepID=UPI0001A43EAA|nr:YSIRK signal domain/LPXTG anchor domain surface protein [Lactobacillus jensenii]EEQ68222.1 LPXTG-motif cell wall anchor domain protein [Lactobacillus jensenii 1153]KAA9263766.1 YSIRK signal domain/LPXTG anchor domain surface protein [Lactobacillus jensenii]
MLSKNNKKQYNLKHSNGQQHFSFRKTTVGLASVLLSTTLYLGVNSGFVVQAADNSITVGSTSNDKSEVDKSILQSAYDNAINIQKTDVKYINETDISKKNTYDDAINNAKTVIENESATSEDVTNASQKLLAAYNALTGINENTNKTQTLNSSSIENNTLSSNALETSLASTTLEQNNQINPDYNGDFDSAGMHFESLPDYKISYTQDEYNQYTHPTGWQTIYNEDGTVYGIVYRYKMPKNDEEAEAEGLSQKLNVYDLVQQIIVTDPKTGAKYKGVARVDPATTENNKLIYVDGTEPDADGRYKRNGHYVNVLSISGNRDGSLDQAQDVTYDTRESYDNNFYPDQKEWTVANDPKDHTKQPSDYADDEYGNGNYLKLSQFENYSKSGSSNEPRGDIYVGGNVQIVNSNTNEYYLALGVTTLKSAIDKKGFDNSVMRYILPIYFLGTNGEAAPAQETNKDELQKAVEEKPAVEKTASYENASEDAKKAYDDAVAEGQKVLDDANASQTAVDEAKAAIDKAKAELDGKETNKDELQKAVEEKPAVEKTASYENASEDAKKAYDDAVAEGQKVLDDANASQTAVDEAKAAIDKAKAELDGKETQLDEILNLFDKTLVEDLNNLTDEEKNQVEANIRNANSNKPISSIVVKDNGQTIVNFENGAQKELTPDQTIIKKEVTNTEKKTEQTTPVNESSVNKDALKNEINNKDQIKSSTVYTNASSSTKKAYDDALEKAQAVLADKNASQADVDTALANLNSASQKLDGKDSPETSSTTKNSINAKKLPQTGSQNETTRGWGLSLLALALVMLGFGKKRKKN